MRTLIKLFTTIFALVLLFSCYRKEDSSLFVIEKDGRYGYVNAKGDTIIDCVYPWVYTDTIIRIGFVVDHAGHIQCFNNKGKYLFDVFKYDNGPDAPKEGLFRIINKNGLMGFADTIGNLVIPPKYKLAYPSRYRSPQILAIRPMVFYITQREITYVGSITAPEVVGFIPMKVRLCTAGGSIPII